MAKTKAVSTPETRDADPDGPAITLAPSTATAGDPTDLTMVVTGEGFTDESVIMFDGLDEPTTLISDTEVSTGVKPSLFIVPAVCPVYVVTGEVATQSADFTFNERPAPSEPDGVDLLTAQLKSYGVSGEPVGWAPPRKQAVIVAIRAYNLGFGDLATVQGMLDISYPTDGIMAADVVTSTPLNSDPVVKSKQLGRTLEVRLDQELDLPDDNIVWTVDGVRRGIGSPLDLGLDPGEHNVTVSVAIAGSVFTASRTVTVDES